MSEAFARTLALLHHISSMVADNHPLPAILQAVSEATQSLTQASWGLVLNLPTVEAPEFYGPERVLALGPSLLRHLRQRLPLESPPGVLQLALPEDGSICFLVVPLLSREGLRGAVAALYVTPPEPKPNLALRLLGNQALIAIEKFRLESIVSQRDEGTIRALASAIDARDPSTHRHSQAVTDLAVSLAQAIGLDEEAVSRIRYAAILHDVGKIGIAESILFKPGPLTEVERAVVEAHPLVGVSILSGIPDMKELIPLIRHHHERYDGSGYPDGLRGDEIPLGAHILAIADSFDAMTNERPYHQGLSILEACAILEKEAGRLFDPELVPIFCRMIRQRIGVIETEDSPES